MEFLNYTVGLEANKGKKIGVMVKVEFRKLDDGKICLQPVSGRSLSKLNGTRIIEKSVFDMRPSDVYNKVPEAKWALNLCGWELMTDGHKDKEE